ncbi:telomere length regulation protein TEL2 homolog [Panonychus citri]|uniref:telomere length regulation protein TEL2 homolog n=1 Tax=Panonychus citri TaxID=50023 RepID=UPI00230714FB|nr:telomere length regulation protein TEL2 homolog [Panonychus citri]
MWSTLLSKLSSASITGIPWDYVEEFKFTLVTDSQEDDYLNCCRIILHKMDQSSLIVKDCESLLDNLILKRRLNLLPIICGQLTSSDESYRRDKLLDLLVKFIFSRKHFTQTFELIVENGLTSNCGLSKLADDEMIRCLINLPSIVANKMKLTIPQSMIPINYFSHLCSIISNVFGKIYKRIRLNCDCRIDFFSSLIGRISSSGYSDIVWEKVTSPILTKCSKDFIWRRIGHKLIISQNDRNIEGIIRPLIMFASDPNQIKWILQNSPSSSQKISYLLTEKFILNNYYDKHSFVINLIGYLANISTDLFIKTFDNLLSAWSNGVALKHRPFDQQFYLCCGLAVSAKYLKSVDLTKQQRDKFTNCIIYAMQIYLSSVLPETRFTGLYIGQTLLALLKTDGPQLELEIEKVPEVITLMEIYGSEIYTIKPEVSEEEDNQSSELEKIESSMDNLTTADEEDDDDDDDLVPYDLSNDVKVDQTKKPIYMVDCISGLRDNENADWHEICLKSVIEIIEKNKSMIEDYAEELAVSLLNLQDTFELPDFVPIRRDAMVKLLTYSPKTVSNYLTGQFYENNLVIERRLLILETLAMASQEIVKSSSNQTENNPMITKMIPNDIVIAESKWKTIVEDRVMRNTKIISKPREKAKNYTNQFIPVAGHFFFPLMKNHDSQTITFNLSGEDYYLLGRLLYTLGIILESASQSPITRRMGKSLIDFLWAFRYHIESFVRQAIIFCLCMIFISVPKAYLLDYMQSDLIEFQKWLLDVTEKDSDKDCIERALNALFLMKQLIESEEL